MTERLDKYRDADPTDPAEDVAFANAVAVAMNGTAAGLFAHGPVPQGGPAIAGDTGAEAGLEAARATGNAGTADDYTDGTRGPR